MCNMQSNEHLIKLIPMRNVHDAEKLPFLRLNFEFYVWAASSSNSLISEWPFHFSSVFFFSMKSVFTLWCHSWLLWSVSFSFNLEYFFVSPPTPSLCALLLHHTHFQHRFTFDNVISLEDSCLGFLLFIYLFFFFYTGTMYILTARTYFC